MTREVLSVFESFLEEDMHHAECESRVCAGSNVNPFVALSRGPCAQRIDGNDRRTTAAGLEHKWPEVRIGGEGVGPPKKHQITFGNSLSISTDVGAEAHAHSDRAGH